MNDLMTRSFLSYVDLKKQAVKDLEAGPDIEMGQLDPADERNLTQFFELVANVKADMEEITNLLLDLKDLNDETKSAYSAKVFRGLRDRINSDMVTVLRKANQIKTKLESLDRSNGIDFGRFKRPAAGLKSKGEVLGKGEMVVVFVAPERDIVVVGDEVVAGDGSNGRRRWRDEEEGCNV